MEQSEGSRTPECSINKAIERLILLKKMHPKTVTPTQMGQETGLSRSRHSTEMSFLLGLGWVKKEKKGNYTLSEIGFKLLDPSIADEVKIDLVAETLERVYRSELISIFSGEVFDRKTVSSALMKGIGRVWNTNTASVNVGKFISFLKYAGFVEGSGKDITVKVIPCENCKTLISREAKFCPNCGTKKRKKDTNKCPQCNVVTKSSWKYCDNCGFDLGQK